jgi:hypothetical protein
MVATLAFTANGKTRNGITVTLAGDAATTARNIQVTHPSGAVQNCPVTTTGGGGATCVVVPGEPGTLSATVLSVPGAASIIVAATTTTIVT